MHFGANFSRLSVESGVLIYWSNLLTQRLATGLGGEEFRTSTPNNKYNNANFFARYKFVHTSNRIGFSAALDTKEVAGTGSILEFSVHS